MGARTLWGMALIERMATRMGLVTRAQPQAPEGFGANVVPPARTPDAAVVSPLDATTIDAVYRALQVIETGMLQLSLDVWRKLSGVTEKLADLPAIVERPNVDMDGATFYASTGMALAARGNAYWLKSYGHDGAAVINMDLLDPLQVHIEYDRRRRRTLYHTDVRSDPYTSREVSHLALLRLPGSRYGLGPIQAAQQMLRGQLALRDYADGWFDGAHVDATLTTDQHLSAEQAKQYKQQWNETQRMKDGPAVLGAGLSYNPLSLKPSELQWLEAQRFGVTGVARLFGIPSSYMLAPVEGANLTYKNQEQEDLSLVRFTLMRYLREMELAISRVLPRTQWARFNVDALLRTDTLTRYQAHQIGLAAGFLDVPEVRAIEGLAPRTIPTPTPAEENASV